MAIQLFVVPHRFTPAELIREKQLFHLFGPRYVVTKAISPFWRN